MVFGKVFGHEPTINETSGDHFRGSPKCLQFIQRVTQTSVPNFKAIHAIAVETFRLKPQMPGMSVPNFAAILTVDVETFSWQVKTLTCNKCPGNPAKSY